MMADTPSPPPTPPGPAVPAHQSAAQEIRASAPAVYLAGLIRALADRLNADQDPAPQLGLLREFVDTDLDRLLDRSGPLREVLGRLKRVVDDHDLRPGTPIDLVSRARVKLVRLDPELLQAHARQAMARPASATASAPPASRAQPPVVVRRDSRGAAMAQRRPGERPAADDVKRSLDSLRRTPRSNPEGTAGPAADTGAGTGAAAGPAASPDSLYLASSRFRERDALRQWLASLDRGRIGALIETARSARSTAAPSEQEGWDVGIRLAENVLATHRDKA